MTVVVTNGLRFRARHFMKKYIYVRMIWDGSELIAFDEVNQPCGLSDLMPGSAAHHAFTNLLEACDGVAPFEEEMV